MGLENPWSLCLAHLYYTTHQKNSMGSAEFYHLWCVRLDFSFLHVPNYLNHWTCRVSEKHNVSQISRVRLGNCNLLSRLLDVRVVTEKRQFSDVWSFPKCQNKDHRHLAYLIVYMQYLYVHTAPTFVMSYTLLIYCKEEIHDIGHHFPYEIKTNILLIFSTLKLLLF